MAARKPVPFDPRPLCTVVMVGSKGGRVDLLCGPSEYLEAMAGAIKSAERWEMWSAHIRIWGYGGHDKGYHITEEHTRTGRL